MFSFIHQIGNKIRTKLAIQDRMNQVLQRIVSVVASSIQSIEGYLSKHYNFHYPNVSSWAWTFSVACCYFALTTVGKLENKHNLDYEGNFLPDPDEFFAIVKNFKSIDPYLLINKIAFMAFINYTIRLYSIRLSLKDNLRNYIIGLSEQDNVDFLQKIENIFSSKLITNKEKADLLFYQYECEQDNVSILKLISFFKGGENSNTRSIEHRDFLIISLIQRFLSSEEINILLYELYVSNEMNDNDYALNILGILISDGHFRLMRDIFSILTINSSRKFRLLMEAHSSIPSSLLMISLIIQQKIIIANNSGEADLRLQNDHEVLELLIQESESLENEQRLVFLTQVDAQNNTALSSLVSVVHLREVLKNAIKTCASKISPIGAVLSQVAHQKSLPNDILSEVMSFKGIYSGYNAFVLNYGFNSADQIQSQKTEEKKYSHFG